MIRIGCLLLVIGLAKAATLSGQTCLSDADCLDTQCCYKKHAELIVSKRGDTFQPWQPQHHQDLTNVHGFCQGYHNEGDSCSPFDKTNGYCSCNEKAGVTCSYSSADDNLHVFGVGYKCRKA